MATLRKFAANYIYTGSGEWLKNGIVTLNADHKILEVFHADEKIREMANMAFYNGLIIPGWFLLYTGADGRLVPTVPREADQKKLFAAGCNKIILGGKQAQEILPTNKKTPEISYLSPEVLPHTPTFPQTSVTKPNLTLYKTNRTNILLVKLLHPILREEIEILAAFAGSVKATLVFQGNPVTLSQIYQEKHIQGIYYIVTLSQILKEKEALHTLDESFFKNMILSFSSQTIFQAYKPETFISMLLSIFSHLHFEDLLSWIILNPATLFNFRPWAGVITKNSSPGLVLVSPFHFGQRMPLPESQFSRLI